MINLIYSFLTKKAILDVYIQDGCLLVRHCDNGVETDYRLLDKHRDKLLSYKTLAGALKFTQANDSTKYYNQSKQITQELIAEAKAEVTPLCPETALTDDGATPHETTTQAEEMDNVSTPVLCANELPQRFSYDDLMLIRLCTSDRLAKLYDDAPFCNYTNQHLINDVTALRGQIDDALADLDNHIQKTVKALDDGAGEFLPTAESTPTDNPLSNGVPVSFTPEQFLDDDLPQSFLHKTCQVCGLPEGQVCDECSWEVDRELWEVR